MAVVQISRIQIRRGKSSVGTGFPQLASGEMGWAIDTQELYIGNGAVAEGSPAVGNTKILTQNDLTAQGNLLQQLQHIYRTADPTIVTGASANTPISRLVQDRLDDRVTSADFGTVGDGATDDTQALQRAIDQLFLNPTNQASDDTVAGTRTRVVLDITPGIYKITSTLYVPSYATIRGAGSAKVILQYSGTASVIQFVNDTSTIGNPSTIGNSSYINQPRHIELSNLSIVADSNDQTILQLDAVRDSVFENLILTGTWNNSINQNSNGIALYAFSSAVTCERNVFNNIQISGFTYGVYAKQDILNNTFTDGYVTDTYQGFVLGVGANGSSVGEQFGPRDTIITNYRFEDIKRHAVIVKRGTGNSTQYSKLINVGNDGAGTDSPIYPQIYFDVAGNSSHGDSSDRAAVLATANLQVPYIPEVSGYAEYNSYSTSVLPITNITSDTFLFRLPISISELGTPERSIMYTIDYIYRGNDNFSRKGTMNLVVDVDASTDTNASVVQLTDEYDYTGPDELKARRLTFVINLLDEVGDIYVGSIGQVPFSIAIYFSNNGGDSGVLTYKYNAVL